MPFLLDTNCWLQLVRAREHVQEVRDFLASVPPSEIRVTDFSLHSIGVAMRRHKMLEAFPDFIVFSGIGQSVDLIRLAPAELYRVVDACHDYKLDFDDAFQYVAAELYNLRLVSFDADFDQTPRGRLTPAASLQLFMNEQRKQSQT